MRKIIAVLVAALFFIAGTNIAFAKDKEKHRKNEMKEEKEKKEKGEKEKDEALESQAGTMPPGLEKQDKTPKGLEKKGKTPKGWQKGKKEGWKK